jgi:hypothetical protein
LANYEIDIDKLISIETDLTEIDAIITQKDKDLIAAKSLLGEIQEKENSKSLQDQLKDKQISLKLETDKLNTDQKLYTEVLVR